MTTTTEVTQADRLAAKELMSHIRGYGVDLPYDGHFATQAFANHRAQALAQGRLEGAEAIYGEKGWRRREVQAIGAAISTRNWHSLETAYNQLRDKMDAAERLFKPSIASQIGEK